MSDSSWILATDLMRRFLTQPARLEHLMERLPEGIEGGKRRRCQSLLYGSVRHLSLLRGALDCFLKKKPKPGLLSCLVVASYELWAEPDKRAKIVDHAVLQVGRKYSRAERGLANAVLRKVADKLEAYAGLVPKDVPGLALRFSHPLWLVERWTEMFGFDQTRLLLEWNQSEPAQYLRVFPSRRADVDLAQFEASDWPDFYVIDGNSRKAALEVVDAGQGYIQNPGARSAPSALIKHFSGGRVLDLCASPGGKSIFLSEYLASDNVDIVAVDLPGPRIARLRENFARYEFCWKATILEADILNLDPAETGLFGAALLDAPCSNTGVAQHKVDAKWRLQKEDLSELVVLQGKLLAATALLIAPGGILVYSTCSIDPEENSDLVASFLECEAGAQFELLESIQHMPSIEGHDGAGVFVLAKRKE